MKEKSILFQALLICSKFYDYQKRAATDVTRLITDTQSGMGIQNHTE